MRGISWLAAKPVNFSRRTLLHGVCKQATSWIFSRDGVNGASSPFGFGTLVMTGCRIWRSYLWTVLTRGVWRCCSTFSSINPTAHFSLPSNIPPAAHDSMLMTRDKNVCIENIARVPPSLHFYHSTLLFRLRLVIRSVLSVPVLIPLVIVHNDFG